MSGLEHIMEREELISSGRFFEYEGKLVWSKKYDECVRCGTTEHKHRSKGICKKCYAEVVNQKKGEKLMIKKKREIEAKRIEKDNIQPVMNIKIKPKTYTTKNIPLEPLKQEELNNYNQTIKELEEKGFKPQKFMANGKEYKLPFTEFSKPGKYNSDDINKLEIFKRMKAYYELNY